MTLLDVGAGGRPLAGAAVYLWHCGRDGRYSMYDEPVAGENFLRGVQHNVFSDGYASQLASASGSVATGLTMKLDVGV